MKHLHSFKRATPEELHSWLTEQKRFTLIDTLPADHFQRMHLPTAKNACVYEITFLTQIAAICPDTGSPIVVYGAGSNSLEARTAAEKLSMAGYSDVTVLDGGIDRWRQTGLPLEGEAPDEDDYEQQRLLTDGRYTILLDKSFVGWTGRNQNTHHFGTIRLSGGTLQISGNALQGGFTLDMESIENINLAGDELQQVLVSHLKSDDFFFVDAFPAARFDIPGGRILHAPYPTSPNCEISGTLDLRGVQNSLSFKATATRQQDDCLHLSAHFDLDRTLWGINYGSSRFYRHLGMHTVFDLVSIELRIIAEKL